MVVQPSSLAISGTLLKFKIKIFVSFPIPLQQFHSHPEVSRFVKQMPHGSSLPQSVWELCAQKQGEDEGSWPRALQAPPVCPQKGPGSVDSPDLICPENRLCFSKQRVKLLETGNHVTLGSVSCTFSRSPSRSFSSPAPPSTVQAHSKRLV